MMMGWQTKVEDETTCFVLYIFSRETSAPTAAGGGRITFRGQDGTDNTVLAVARSTKNKRFFVRSGKIITQGANNAEC